MNNSITPAFNSPHEIGRRISDAVATTEEPLAPLDIFTESELEWIGDHFSKRGEDTRITADCVVRTAIGVARVLE